MTVKTPMSRFHIHDDESAPPGSLPVIKGALGASGQLPNFIGVLAGSPAALRAYARFRSELRRGTLPHTTLERISLGVAEHYGSGPGVELHQRTARQQGLGLDEVQAARAWDSGDEREQALLVLLRESLAGASPLPAHLVEEAREHGWSDEQILEAIAFVALESFTAMVNVAGDVPADGSLEESRTLHAA
ncbi:MAG: carboxymuconolactone decarboxylase family protein [Solirubrobacteraceae bacterium]